MGEMPRLSNTDPWQIAQAFQHAYGRQGLTPYQQANLALKQQKLAGQDAADDAAADAEDGSSGGTDTDMSVPANRPPIMTQPMPPAQIKPLISQAATDAGVSLPLFTRLVKAESSFNPNAVSPTGAKGLTQLMPGTAKMLGVNPNDPAQNLAGGARYLAQQEATFHDDGRALAAYNWGPGNVKKWIANGADPSKAPRETQDYVKKITGKQLASNDEPVTTQDDNNPDTTDPSSRLAWLA